MEDLNYKLNELGTSGRLVQFYETIFNYTRKSHRGHSPENRTIILTL